MMSRKGMFNPIEDNCMTCYDLRLALMTYKRKEPTQAWRIYLLIDQHKRDKHIRKRKGIP